MVKYAVLIEPNKIEIQHNPKPILAKNEIRAKVKYAGICKTDIVIFTGDYSVPLPLVLGHEWIGEAVEIADSKFSYLHGKRITADINNSCIATLDPQQCRLCKMNMPNHCSKRSVTGIICHDGAFAEEIVVPAGAVFTIPDEIDDKDAIFIEPLAAALRTFELSELKPGDVTVIFGAGKLGILLAIAARAAGADVILVSKTAKKKHLAETFGFELFISDKVEDIKKIVDSKTGGIGADFVIEASGDPAALGNALQLVRPRGILSVKSTPGTPSKGFDITKFVVDEITLQGTRCGSFPKAMEFLIKHKPPLHKIISEIFPLDDVENALRQSINAQGKILIKP